MMVPAERRGCWLDKLHGDLKWTRSCGYNKTDLILKYKITKKYVVFTSPFSLSWLSEFLVHVHQNFQVDLDSFPNIGYVYSNDASLIFFI